MKWKILSNQETNNQSKIIYIHEHNVMITNYNSTSFDFLSENQYASVTNYTTLLQFQSSIFKM